MFQKSITAAAVAFGAAIVSAGPVLAGGGAVVVLPAPGVPGLIAIGVVGAIAFARSRK